MNNKKAKGNTFPSFTKLYNLLNDLGWEYQRMSTDGQTTLNEIYAMLGIPEYHEEDSISLMDMKEDVRQHLYGDGGKNEWNCRR